MRFEFATATRVLFGAGVVRDIPVFGSHPLIVTGRNTERASRLGVDGVLFPIDGEPTLGDVDEGVAIARQDGCDMVIGFGGGSAIDAGKAIAAVLANPGEALDYLEVVGGGQILANPSVPFVAVPTTAGTGSEVTRNAVLASPEHRVKASMRSPHMLPLLAVVDPELTMDLPPAITASTGLDALTQLIEPFVCNRANPITDALCRHGMSRVANALRRAYHQPGDLEARTDMALSSLMGGMALANAGLGAVHGFAAPIGGMFDAPHGAICAALLPYVVDANLRAMRESGRYTEVARILTGNPEATASDAVTWLHELVTELQIPSLRTYGITSADVPEIASKAAKASSMKANPVVLSKEQLQQLLLSAL